MGGIVSDELRKEGYGLTQQLEAALPMSVWAVDLEIEQQRLVSAAELAILKLVEAGVSEVTDLTNLLGMGKDVRLAERVLVGLLGAGAIETDGGQFTLTSTGHGWMAEGRALGRLCVSFEIRLDPARDAFEWVDHERPVFSNQSTWTIDLPAAEDEALLRRKAEVGELLREGGLPDDDEKAPSERLGSVELRGLAISSRRIHWRAVQLDVLVHPRRLDSRIVAFVGGAENPPLTGLLARHTLSTERRRLVNA